ncbi:MAG: type I-MYXAN CRISPR-associated protein Cas6/Cmx6 [Gammaproteobacteria bacterium]|nr:type I-MYXAN CRISPR-associated protein Cas6/Cmx6 [Gammaproteobacteria bacterium]
MYWEEDDNEEQFLVPDDVMDLLFQIDCPALPVDHAWPLSREIQQVLPWFEEEPKAGLHLIHGAESGNGWERPQAADDLLMLSRRVKLELRLPRHRIPDGEMLSGATLDVAGYKLVVGKPKTRRLSMTNFLYSRYVAADKDWSEDDFMSWAVQELQDTGVRFRKALCGKAARFNTPNGTLHTKSLMIADLSYEDAVTLQESGIGPHRTMGCGLFIPQKSF